MKILYKSVRVKKQFCPEYSHRWKYSEKVKRSLLSIYNAFVQAPCLFDIVQMPQYHFHPLLGERKKEWSIYVGNTGYRITLIPCDENEKEIISGDILLQCQTVEIVLVTEVSNHYE